MYVAAIAIIILYEIKFAKIHDLKSLSFWSIAMILCETILLQLQVVTHDPLTDRLFDFWCPHNNCLYYSRRNWAELVPIDYLFYLIID